MTPELGWNLSRHKYRMILDGNSNFPFTSETFAGSSSALAATRPPPQTSHTQHFMNVIVVVIVIVVIIGIDCHCHYCHRNIRHLWSMTANQPMQKNRDNLRITVVKKLKIYSEKEE